MTTTVKVTVEIVEFYDDGAQFNRARTTEIYEQQVNVESKTELCKQISTVVNTLAVE